MLISDEYRTLNNELHRDSARYGSSGRRWRDLIMEHFYPLVGMDMLDYGCGKGSLNRALPFDIAQYDPAVAGVDATPEPHDGVVCIDVLEHIEPEYLDRVLTDLNRVCKRAAFLVIDSGAASKTLSDGRNAHLIIENANWWWEQLAPHFTLLAELPIALKGHLAIIVVPTGKGLRLIPKKSSLGQIPRNSQSSS